jgi:transcription elongation GreA/GreB family factor
VDKRALVDLIIAHLTAELERFANAARSAQAEATNEQSKAENKYDTRGLEASYLAHGQSRQARETELARQQFANLPLRDFSAQDAIEVGALVELERTLYFLGPSAGGTEVTHQGREVLVITPQSPLGQQLIGKRQGERISAGRGEKGLIAGVA